jgi:hypothetical protein
MANEFRDSIASLERQKTAIEQALSTLREVDDNGGVGMRMREWRRLHRSGTIVLAEGSF